MPDGQEAKEDLGWGLHFGTTNLTNYTNLAWLATSFLTAKKDEMRERKTWVADSFLTTEKTEYTEVFPGEACFSYLVFGV